MKGLSPATRITIGLASVSVSVLLLAQSLGMIPDPDQAKMRTWSKLCETVAINFAVMASEGHDDEIVPALEALVARNDDLLSATVRRDGTTVAHVGEATDTDNEKSEGDVCSFNVPIFSGPERWGTIRMRFRAPMGSSLMSILWHPSVQFILFVAALGFLANMLYLGRMLKYMDPSRVVPDRVRTTLDTLTEGLLVLDKDDRIVLANEAFGETIGADPHSLLGRSASEFGWKATEDADTTQPFELPWRRAVSDGQPQRGVMLNLDQGLEDPTTFLVNTAPIHGDDGKLQGSLTSFDDITPLEQKKTELRRMFEMLKISADEIHRQNEQLEELATHDPLTSCLNRRAFFERFEQHWCQTRESSQPISCLMVDVDHFKSINDNFGHSTGDVVLQRVAKTLSAVSTDTRLVCRFGGEEFAIMLAGSDADEATQLAEQLRVDIESLVFDEEMQITASLGVSTDGFGAPDPQALLDEADRCLYVAKRNGRNQVVRWDDVPEDEEFEEASESRTAAPNESQARNSVPFQAVTALISALAYRDLSTAEHSRRVADVAVAVGDGLMPLSESYILETAALLHDIGKIGVPDSILLKPGALTADEWKVMHAHDRIGVEIISASFDSDHLTSIIENHHAFYGGNPHDPELPSGEDIPLGARILTIADAYDAMVSDRVYRKGRTAEEAFAELRRCAGAQFDPKLVERFIEIVAERNERNPDQISGVSKDAALTIGIQIERLSQALDRQDLDGIRIMAQRLREVAVQQSIPELAEKSSRLSETIAGENEVLAILEDAVALLELCRSTQKSYLANVNTARQTLQAASA